MSHDENQKKIADRLESAAKHYELGNYIKTALNTIKENLINEAYLAVDVVMIDYYNDIITKNEKNNQIIDIWTHTNAMIAYTVMYEISKDKMNKGELLYISEVQREDTYTFSFK